MPIMPTASMLLVLSVGLRGSTAEESPPTAAGRCCKANAGCTDPEECLDPKVQTFCAASKENCEGKCKHIWCSGGGGGSSNFSVDASHALHNATEQYVSFTFDLSAWFGFAATNNFSDPNFIAAARSFRPALLRMGGTAGDNTTYDMGGRVSSESGIPFRTMTRPQFDAMCDFASAAGWQIVFGLNALQGFAGASGWAWDETNARELMEYAVRKKCPVVGWELGNEPNLNNKNGAVQTGAGVAKRFSSLLKLMQSVYDGKLGLGTPTSPWVVGPDVTKGGVSNGFLGDFLAAFQPASALSCVTWHHYYTAGKGGVVSTAEYLDPQFLDTYVDAAQVASAAVQKFRADSGTNPMLWMGETSGAGGATSGAHLVIGRFLGVFWSADKLGAAARTGHSVVMKQTYLYTAFAANADGSGVAVSPEYWVSLLWKRHMGAGALAVSGGGGLVRVYASLATGGVVAVVIINLGTNATQVPVEITGSGAVAQQHERYTLTAWPDATDMQANATAVNGKEVRLGPGGVAPTLTPASAHGSVVSVPAHSVTFAVFR